MFFTTDIKMDNEYLKKVNTALILLALIVISFFIVRPLIYSIIVGVVLGIMFQPVYNWIHKSTNSKNLSAFIICTLLLILIILPLWFLTPVIVKQSFIIFKAAQQIDFVTPLKSIFPSILTSETFANEIGSAIYSFTIKATNAMTNFFSSLILNFTTIFLQMLIMFFTLFYVLRDKEELISYVESLSPFSKDVEKKIFKASNDVTMSVLYGQVVMGILQGIVVGISFFLFKVPNALLFTLLAALVGIFPIIGTAIIWIPVVIYLFVGGNVLPAIGVMLFGMASSIVENFLKPIFISNRTKMNTSVILIGMIGGLFLFGILGVILGPLILAYLLIILEIYRNKRVPGIFIQPEKNEK